MARGADWTRRVAVVVGVGDYRESLPTLPGAGAGARAFAAWAEQAGYEVHPLLDDDGSVRRSGVHSTIERLTYGTVSQLLVYFSGHGLSLGIDEDFWVLTPGNDASETFVDVRTSLNNARAYSRIRHIVVFADACRTIAGKEHIQGAHSAAPIFPAPLGAPNRADTAIDIFYATKTGEVALERAPAGMTPEQVDDAIVGTHGFFTEALLPALRGDVPSCLRPDLETGAVVLYAENLAAYLGEQLPMMTGEAVLLSQEPDSRPASRHPLFVAQLRAPQTAPLTIEARFPDGTLAQKARVTILDLTNSLLPVDLATSTTGTITRELKHSVFYGAKAFLGDHYQSPRSPNPITMVLENLPPVVVTLMPKVRALGDRLGRPGARSPSLQESFVLDASGEPHAVSPTDGIFSVVGRDLLSGRTKSEIQVLRAGSRPALLRPLEADPDAEERLRREIELDEKASALRHRLEAGSGLAVIGAEVEEVVTRDGRVDLAGAAVEGAAGFAAFSLRATGSAIVRLRPQSHRNVPTLRAAVALFPGFLGQLLVTATGVRSLSYSATDSGEQVERELANARAFAQAAARADRFDVVIDQARPIARELDQHCDPVLGILAAYAYHQVGDSARIRAMIGRFDDAGQWVPFDLLLLAGIAPSAVGGRVAPAFPLLTAGWHLLGRVGAIHPALKAARAHLTPSLWTTVKGAAGGDLQTALRKGDLS